MIQNGDPDFGNAYHFGTIIAIEAGSELLGHTDLQPY